MKVLILVVIALLSGCERDIEQKQNPEFTVIKYDGCQYLMKGVKVPYAGYGYLAHKGNCNNKIHETK